MVSGMLGALCPCPLCDDSLCLPVDDRGTQMLSPGAQGLTGISLSHAGALAESGGCLLSCQRPHSGVAALTPCPAATSAYKAPGPTRCMHRSVHWRRRPPCPPQRGHTWVSGEGGATRPHTCPSRQTGQPHSGPDPNVQPTVPSNICEQSCGVSKVMRLQVSSWTAGSVLAGVQRAPARASHKR